MRRIYSTSWGNIEIVLSARWWDASCPIEGLPGFNVGAVKHSPREAMRLAITRQALAEGLNPNNGHVADMIDDALGSMRERIEP